MSEQIKVTVVDAPMGYGKTSAAINMINESPDDAHFLYITPYLEEVDRIIKNCPKKKFKQPRHNKGSKLDNILELINKGENIVSTHALFKKFNKETIELTYINNYTLIMDEVADVVDVYTDSLDSSEDQDDTKRFVSSKDIKNILEKYAYVDPETDLLKWTDSDYHGVFDDIKRMAELDSLTIYNNQILIWLFPVAVFKAFRHIYILTYLFDSQVQKYYYDFYNMNYNDLYVIKENDKYEFTTDKPENIINPNMINYKELITIVDNEKLNLIGNFEYSLSSTWYKNATKETLTKLKNNMYNFFRNQAKTSSEQNLWTTFKKFKPSLHGKGYTKGFAPLNSRATNQYKDRTAVAYPVNRYLNPNIKNYFITHGMTVHEDEYALSEMLQFIWRSAIRENKPIIVYIPSKRMRKLLTDWIDLMCACL